MRTRDAALAAEKRFRRERTRIRRRLPGAIIEHVGATSVRAMPTKSDLDIVVRVDSASFSEAERRLLRLYRRNLQSERNSEFASFEDNRSTPPLGVQLVAIGSAHDDFDLIRDQFRVSASCRRSFARIKRRFSGKNMARYRRAKAAALERIAKKEPLATLLAGRRSRTPHPKN
ncbi:MAG: GrpB family protein [Phycisphaeraceae bacterium]|nr:GrpB family protein [Phycisphaeraceae bacterium]